MKLEDVKGIGPKTIISLNKLNINTYEDLITYYPYRYEIIRANKIEELKESYGTITGIIDSSATISYIKRNLNRLSFRINTSNRLIKVVLFNRAFLKNQIQIGKYVTLTGKYNEKNNTFVVKDINFFKLDKTMILPKYHLISEVKNKTLRAIIQNALEFNFNITDYIPIYLNKTYNFINKKEAILTIHNPLDYQTLKKAKLRLIYEELFLFMFKINYLKLKNTINTKGVKRNIDYDFITDFIQNLPFSLTTDQQNAVDEIINDFNSSKRMNRLILGDVGSGKTIISFISLYANYLNNYQGALMAPTEILAKQHYESMQTIFANYNINIALLIGSMKKSQKDEVKKMVRENKIDILIGTHAILSDDLEFHNLGLVITDEQHRFGVNQRSCLQNKGQRPDVIYMSATPIPRTYALTLYGDMDTSIIKTKPKGRKEIITKVKTSKDMKTILAHILKELKLGHQIYVVAPSIEESEDDVENVKELKTKFTKAFNNKIKIGVLFGKQKADLKEQTMLDFKNKKYNILISTTVIEVGIDVPNATMIVVFNAERFGLATLHQLRGRVGRNSLDSFCYLISNQDNSRLKVLEESNDGFYISEQDFKLRGEGDLFGSAQSGDMTFKLANLQHDYKILLQAKKDSLKYLEDNINTQFINEPIYRKVLEEIDFID